MVRIKPLNQPTVLYSFSSVSSSPSLAKTAQVRSVSKGGIGGAASTMKASVSAWFSTLRPEAQVAQADVKPNLDPRTNRKLGERIKVLNKKV